jgi:hypothetical protein
VVGVAQLQDEDARRSVAFALVVGLRELATVPDADGVAFARVALGAAVSWVSGADVGADTITNHLMNDDEGLLLFEDRCPDDACRRAWIPAQTALAYAAWHAWRDGSRPGP